MIRQVGLLTDWTSFHDGPFKPNILDPGYKRAVCINPRDAGGTVSVLLNSATFRFGTLGDQGNLERGGTYALPRELAIAIVALGAGTLA